DALALWDVQVNDGVVKVTLLGEFGETTDFSELCQHLSTVRGPIEFDLASVRSLNSWGVRNWVGFLEALPASLPYAFVRASVAFVTQAGMVGRVLGRGGILSFQAPYHCDSCERSEERLLQSGSLSLEGGIEAPRFRCGMCDGEMAFDDIAE